MVSQICMGLNLVSLKSKLCAANGVADCDFVAERLL
ncbi:hypothetical protein PSECIP111951_02000 [Pseudoalteromonas holothuriae]|uniref:Uncharacterized protein n=1 Tax=Pseudoalteromonas holothuriae TaxID=2963714 RepID=A0A9W4QUR2_9GAMM|nr:hypothetical protein PSECIP111854_01383 [Pseudoalteromonas sp. CIP111854]CAH9059071.1 hypothetical protein PSECIP111951_02000 [Pseudoalteromonas sp. CIP111951]